MQRIDDTSHTATGEPATLQPDTDSSAVSDGFEFLSNTVNGLTGPSVICLCIWLTESLDAWHNRESGSVACDQKVSGRLQSIQQETRDLDNMVTRLSPVHHGSSLPCSPMNNPSGINNPVCQQVSQSEPIHR